MIPSLTFKGRLPGVLCEAALPPAETPLRLDVAAFVGFAERGPLNTPVVLEELSQYRALFGGDLLVARDEGQPVYAYLPAAIQAFFDNGGRRCYAVRVAGDDARPNHFQLPGLVAWDRADTFAPVIAPAAWVGSWSDAMSVGTQLRLTPFRVTAHRAGAPAETELELPTVASIAAGDLLRLRFAGDAGETWLLLRVARVRQLGPAATTTRGIPVIVEADPDLLVAFPDSGGSPPAPVDAADVEWLPLASLALPPDLGVPVQADLLRFDLLVREGEQTLEIFRDLRFGEGAGYWADALARGGDNAAPAPASDFLAGSSRLRAPTLPDGTPPPFFLPRGMREFAGEYARPMPDEPPLGSPPLPLSGKDGLDHFDPLALFLDADLATVGRRDLMSEAERLLYLDNPPRPLLKLHSLLPIDEIGLVAIPDLAHRAWGPPAPLSATPILLPPPPPLPDWSAFNGCVPPPVVEGPPAPRLPALAPCDAPFLMQGGDAEGPEPGDIRRQLARLPVLQPPNAYEVAGLLAVQGALVTFCAARADLLALLSLPAHFTRRETLEWRQRLLMARPDLYDGPTLSYAAAYHPWTMVREERTPELAPLRPTPPDGTIAGMIAARELARGPWIAPANVALRNVVALAPTLTAGDWAALFEAQVNVLRQQPGHFTPLSAHTLGLEPLLVQISVRRLLIFLRKLVLRRGLRYVFEPNNDRFRQRVQLGLERTLRALVERGALAAFQVETGSSLNTPNDSDNGRFLVAIKVAPTLPIEFITVVMRRTGEGLLEVIER